MRKQIKNLEIGDQWKSIHGDILRVEKIENGKVYNSVKEGTYSDTFGYDIEFPTLIPFAVGDYTVETIN
mgnify:CR=1 FL=1